MAWKVPARSREAPALVAPLPPIDPAPVLKVSYSSGAYLIYGGNFKNVSQVGKPPGKAGQTNLPISSHSTPSSCICFTTSLTSPLIAFFTFEGLKVSVIAVHTSFPSGEEATYKLVSMRTFFSSLK